MSTKRLAVGATAAACLIAGGCYIGPPRPRRVYYEAPPPAVVVVPAPAPGPEVEVAPGVEQPPPPAEVIAPAPGPEVEFLWVPGWWAWEGGRWFWHGGYWGHRPHPGAMWVPHRWVRGPHGGWVHVGGYWRRAIRPRLKTHSDFAPCRREIRARP
jgi:hypothetical protein